MKLSKRVLPITVIVIIGIFAVGIYLTYFQPKSLQTVRLGHLPFTSQVAQFIAFEKGFFIEQGVNVSLTLYRRPDLPFIGLFAGEVDIIDAGLEPGAFASIEKGSGLKIIAGGFIVRGGFPEDNGGAIVVRKDLWDGGIRTIADLKGKTIGTTIRGSLRELWLMQILEKNKLKPEDFTIRYAAANLQVSALAAKQVDATILGEPFTTLAIEKGPGVPILWDADFYERGTAYMWSAVFSTEKFVKEKPEVVKAFLRGYKKGITYYLEAKAEGGVKKAEVAGYIEKYTGTSKDTMSRVRWITIEPEAQVDVQAIMNWQGVYVKYGYMEKLTLPDRFLIEGISLVKR